RWRRSPHRCRRPSTSSSRKPRSGGAFTDSSSASTRSCSRAASTRRSSRCSGGKESTSTSSRTVSTRGLTAGGSCGRTTPPAPSAASCASGARFRQGGRASTPGTGTRTAAPRSRPTVSSPAEGSRSTSSRVASCSSRSTTWTTLLLRLPEPYDFDLSTERFRAFGVDAANLWHEGGLHRVVAGREVRIEAATGGVDVDPLDDTTRPVVEKLLGLEFDLPPFYAWASGQPVLAELAVRLAGFRPPLAPDPFESLVTSITAQQVSLFAAFAIRTRLIERFGERADLAYAFPARERIAGAGEDELVALG